MSLDLRLFGEIANIEQCGKKIGKAYFGGKILGFHSCKFSPFLLSENNSGQACFCYSWEV